MKLERTRILHLVVHVFVMCVVSAQPLKVFSSFKIACIWVRKLGRMVIYFNLPSHMVI